MIVCGRKMYMLTRIFPQRVGIFLTASSPGDAPGDAARASTPQIPLQHGGLRVYAPMGRDVWNKKKTSTRALTKKEMNLK